MSALLPTERIFIIKSEVTHFKNKKELDVYLDYMFSSGGYRGSFNGRSYYSEGESGSDKKSASFIKNAAYQKAEFVKKFKKRLSCFKDIKIELFYIAFVIKVGNRLFSNFIESDRGKLYIHISEDIWYFVLYDFYSGVNSRIKEDFTQLFNVLNPERFSLYQIEDATEEDRRVIEERVLERLRQLDGVDTDMDSCPLISISHHNQADCDMYHIHRLSTAKQ